MMWCLAQVMEHESSTRRRPILLPQRGFAAIAAIFLIVVLAALGGFMLTFSNTQQLTAAQDLQGTRAYWAARAGLEWGVGSVVSKPTACTSTPPTLTSPTPLTIDNFTVCVLRTMTIYTDGNSSCYFQITATAYSPVLANCATAGAVGTVNYVERSVSGAIEMPAQ